MSVTEAWFADALWDATVSITSANLKAAEACVSSFKEVHAPCAATYAMCATFRAILTETPEDFGEAVERLNAAEKLALSQSETQTLKSRLSSLTAWGSSWLTGTKAEETAPIPPYTKIEASIALAEVYLMKALIFIKTSNFVKAGMFLRYSWKQYDCCDQLYRQSISKGDAADGLPHADCPMKPARRQEAVRGDIDFGLGSFHFFIGLTPKSFLWMVEAIGFQGDRDQGFLELLSCRQSKCFRAMFACLLILWIDIFFFQDLDQAEEDYLSSTQHFDHSVLAHYLGGYIYRMRGEISKAETLFQMVFDNSSGFRQLQLAAKYELGWCKYRKLHFQEAAKEFEEFLDEFNSPSFKAFCAYQLGVCYHQLGHYEKASEAFKQIREWKRKHYSYDMYAHRKGEQYLQSGMSKYEEKMIIADIYHQNQQFDLANQTLTDIQEEIESSTPSVSVDDKAMFYYLKGLVLTALDEKQAAQAFYEKVIDLEDQITNERFLIPYSYCELAELLLEQRSSQAQELLQRADTFHGYDFEKPLQRRISLGFDKVRRQQHCFLDVSSH